MPSRRPGGANVPPFDAVADIRKFAVVRDDFTTGLTTSGNIGEAGWLLSNIAGTGSVAYQTGTAGHPGIVRLTSGAVASNESMLSLVEDSILLDSASMIYAAFIVSPVAITAAEINVGLFDDVSSAGRSTDSISLELDISVSGNWFSVVNDGGSATTADSTVTAVAGDWYVVEIAADATHAYTFLNGEQVDDVAGTFSVALTPGVKVAAEGAAAKSVDIDAAIVRSGANRKGFTGVGG